MNIGRFTLHNIGNGNMTLVWNGGQYTTKIDVYERFLESQLLPMLECAEVIRLAMHDMEEFFKHPQNEILNYLADDGIIPGMKFENDQRDQRDYHIRKFVEAYNAKNKTSLYWKEVAQFCQEVVF